MWRATTKGSRIGGQQPDQAGARAAQASSSDVGQSLFLFVVRENGRKTERYREMGWFRSWIHPRRLASPDGDQLFVTLLVALGIGAVPMPRSSGADAAELGIEIWLPLAPPNVRQDGDTLTGYLVELIRLATSRAEVPIDHYEIVPYSRALKEISTSANYCNGLVARTPERETLFTWVAPTRRIVISAFAHAAMPDPPRTLEDLKKHEIAVQRGTLRT
jgi:hypothetical protein